MDIAENKEIAKAAIITMKMGIAIKDKGMILTAYQLVEDSEYFTWDDSNLDNEFSEWDKLVDEGNDILYQ